MDLNTVTAIVPLRQRQDIATWTPGATWLAGGTWLFSEPQPSITTLLDLASLEWPPIVFDQNGLQIAATCTLAQLHALVPPPDYLALGLVPACCRALLGSFKIWNVATVGGNICLALPAAPMIALTVALEGCAVIWMPDGGERHLSIVDFVLGSQKTALAAGEVLRAINVPAKALRRRAAHRQVSLTPLGRSAALLIGTRDRSAFALTVTGATRRPFYLTFDRPPSSRELTHAIGAAIPDDLYHDDMHGRPDWRRHLVVTLAEDIRAELFED